MPFRRFRFGVVAGQAASGDEWLNKARRVEQLGYATLLQRIWKRWPHVQSVLIFGMLLAACGTSTGEAALAPAGSQSRPGGTSGDAAIVRVTATDFRFSLDRAEASAGPITFVIENDGQAPHDFRISGNGVDQKTEVVDQGKTTSLTLDLGASAYSYICTVPGHELLGMKGTFTVR
jgi:plastocyanin